MKFQLSTAVGVLLAGSALAAPSPSKETTRKQQILNKLAKLPKHGQVQPLELKGNKTNTDAPGSLIYDGNWGGGVTTTTGVTSAFATFTVPEVSLPSGDDPSGNYYGCAWVGIDGANGCPNLWQAGAYWLYSGGSWSYFPFYEWFPGPVMTAEGMAIAPGDTLTVEVVATSTTGGTYSFTNTGTGQVITGSISGQPALCQGTAEWIVEDNSDPSVIMPDFGSVTFTSAGYSANGAAVGVSGADTYEVQDNGAIYTNCAVSGSSQVSCSWAS